jgi:hypothetical protein
MDAAEGNIFGPPFPAEYGESRREDLCTDENRPHNRRQAPGYETLAPVWIGPSAVRW